MNLNCLPVNSNECLYDTNEPRHHSCGINFKENGKKMLSKFMPHCRRIKFHCYKFWVIMIIILSYGVYLMYFRASDHEI